MKYKHLLLAAASGASLCAGNAAAQTVNNYGCYTDQHNAELKKLYPQSKQNRQAIENLMQQFIANKKNSKIAGPVMKVPVVVHVLTANGLSGMPKAQVENGIQVLNEDFRRMNADKVNTRPIFLPVAADLEVEFFLAKLDPQGNPTDGINRITSFTANQTLSAFPTSREEVKKAAPAWPTDKYFNVWLLEAWNNTGFGGGQLLGYAQFPGNGSWTNYGVVMLGQQWGKQGAVPGSTANSDGRTTTHEVGHCFNLYHTFQGGCGTTNCVSSGDLVCDTPPSISDTYNCDLNQNTCHNDNPDLPDQVENYMSYDNCQNMFTLGQRDRAHAALSTIPQLQNLTSAANGIATGIDPTVVIGPVLPKAYFASNTTRVCAGSTVNFTDVSYNGPAATAWNWSFPGGTPATSTAQNPSVVYSTPGKYAVTLTTTNANGASQPLTITNYITVSPTTNLAAVAPGQEYVESFESATFPSNANAQLSLERYSTTLDAGTPNWEQTASAATVGNYAVRLRNSSIAIPGTVSTLITPNIDVSAVPSGTLRATFDVAYAMKNSSSNDELRMFYSVDCGQTWSARGNLSGASLVTNGTGNYVAGTFTPSSSQWKSVNMPALNGFSNGYIMFKLEAVSKNGNNSLFVDNFKVYTTATAPVGTGTNEDLAAANKIKVYPNPVTTETGVSFELQTSEKVSVKIFDLVGNIIYNGPVSSMQPGSHTINVADKMKNVSAGMYMLQLHFGSKTFNTKLIAE